MSEVVTTNTQLVPQNMDQAIRLAQAMATAKLVPVHLQGDVGSCLMIIEQAMRWGMSPFAVAQCTSVIYGRLMHEGKLVAAAVQASGVLTTRFQYEYSGSGDDRAVTVSARVAGEEKDRTIQIVLKDVRTKDKEGKVNRQWTGGQIDQQLSYAGVRAWARRHTPEVLLGVYSPEEFDAPPPKPDHFTGTTIEAEQPEQPPQRAAAASTPRAPRRAEPAAPATNGNPATRTKEQWEAWLEKLRAGLGVVRTRAEVVEIGGKSTVGDALATAPDWVARDISAALAEAYGRFPDEPSTDAADEPELPPVEIAGSRYASA